MSLNYHYTMFIMNLLASNLKINCKILINSKKRYI